MHCSKPEGKAGVWIGSVAALISAVVAAVAAILAFSQASEAKRQNELADRQSLASLVSQIEEQTRQLASTPKLLAPRVEEARLADAEQAFALVEALDGEAPTIDKFLIGDAFDDSGEDHVALALLNEAAKDTRSPHYRAAALRLEAVIRYTLGGAKNNRDAAYDAGLAYAAYKDQPDLRPLAETTNEAYTDIYDASRVAQVSCQLALRQYHEALRLVREHPALQRNPTIEMPLQSARRVVRHC